MSVDIGEMRRDEDRGRPSASYIGPATVPDGLAVTFSRLARSLHQESGLDDTLRGIVSAAVQTVPGAQEAALSVIEGRRGVRTRAGSAEFAYQVDQVQYDTGEGPCLTSLSEQCTVRLSDVATETRWPSFTPRAAELGVGSMLAVQLYVEQDNLGALNLYSRQAGAFTDESEQVGLVFATHAALAMAEAQGQERMHRAVEVRDLIGQAKGILMERHKVTGDQALNLLVRASQNSNRKLVEIAAHLVETGALADPRR
ncbi:MAG: GAF and ANTAR domain-containing protein [Micromonosporaceae bacterium]|nr:GAF and ANTAR domain-containing protein [Micromonosporaceae bacterium]